MSQDINDIIQQLSEIDSASAKIMQDTQEEKAKYAEYINQEKQIYDVALKEEIKNEVDAYKVSLEEQNKLLLAQCKENCKRDIEALNKSFEENGSQWADEIFNTIIKE